MPTYYRVVPNTRTHFGLVVFVVLCLVVGLAFYLGWFKVTESREATSNKVDVNLRVDPDKMKNDVRKATDTTEQKASELSDKIKRQAQDIKGRAK